MKRKEDVTRDELYTALRKRGHDVPPSKGHQSGDQVQAATCFADIMTKTTVHAMVHKRSQWERRLLLDLQKSCYRRYCIAAAERSQGDVSSANHQQSRAGQGRRGRSSRQYIDFSIAISWNRVTERKPQSHCESVACMRGAEVQESKSCSASGLMPGEMGPRRPIQGPPGG